MEQHPDDPSLQAAFAAHVTAMKEDIDGDLLDQAMTAARRAVYLTLAADHDSLAVLSEVLSRANRHTEAAQLVDRALILAPADRRLHELRQLSEERHCSPTNRAEMDGLNRP